MEDKENKVKPPRHWRTRNNGSSSNNNDHNSNRRRQSDWTVDTSSMNTNGSSIGSGFMANSIGSGNGSGSGSGSGGTPDVIEFTPQRKGDTFTSRLENAPKKSIRTHSKQHVIRKNGSSSSSSSGSDPRRGRSMSKPHARTRGESYSRGKTVPHRGRRSCSASRSRYSNSNSNHRNDSSHRNRSRSVSQTRSTRSARSAKSATSSLGPMEVEPNVHHNAILTTAIECEVIAEMKENELFARKAGINFTREGGDALTIVASSEDNLLIQDTEYLDDIQLSPVHGKGGNDSSFFHDDELPPNATFLRQNNDDSRHIIGSDEDFAQLRLVAGKLCIDWVGKEFVAPAIARRIRDFQFAQEKRRKKFGNERPWGILGLYDHLSAVRMDVEWAEVAACRRANGEPYKAWFEFTEEKGTGKNRPFFTIIIMSICAGFMLASIAINEWKLESFSVNPMFGPSAETLVRMGAKDSSLIVQHGEVWRMLSAMVLHAGFVHFGLNMLALWFVGSAIEKSHGFAASMLLFVVPAIGGTILSAIFLPDMISVGASGGIFGLIGACLADICLNWGLLFNNFVNEDNKHKHTFVLLALLGDVIVNSVLGLTPFVDNFTHLGGMIFGFLCGTSTMHRISTEMFVAKRNKTCWSSTKKTVLRFIGLIITLTAMCISFTLLMNGDGVTTPCEACKAISCVSFPPWADRNSKWWYCDECGSITAEARIDQRTSMFDQVSLDCPNGENFLIHLDDNMTHEKDWLEGQLPKWCRLHCLES